MSVEQVAPAGDLSVAKSMIGDAFGFLEQKISGETGQDLVTPEIQTNEPQQQESTETTNEQVEEVANVEAGDGLETPETTDEATDTSDIPEGDSATPKAKAKWGEVKKKATSYDKILPEFENLKKKVEAYEKGEGLPQLETLKQQLAEREKRAAELEAREEETEKKALLLDVKSSKAWEKSVKQPFNRLLGDAEALAARNNADAGKLIDAVIKGDEAGLQEVIADWPEFSRTRAWNLLTNLETIQKAKEDIESNPKGAYETIQKQQQDEYEKQTKRVVETRNVEFDKLRPNIEALLKDFPDEAKPNFDEIRKTAISIETLPEHQKVMASMAGHILPQVLDAYKAQATELATLKKENASLRNGAPRASGGTTPPASQQKKEEVVTDSQGLADSIFSRLSGVR